MPAVLRIKQPKEKVNEDQKTFRRLKKQLETLKKKEKTEQAELDQGLLFYHEKIRIEEEKINKALEERVNLTYQFHKKAKSFSKKALSTLKELILFDIESLLKSVGLHGMSQKIEEIGKELGWKGAEATLLDELNPMIEDIESMFASQGIKVDLSNVNIKDGEEEVIRKLFEQVEIGFDQQADAPKKKPSQKLQKIEELQKKSMNAIYKQLAKTLHPDLELDPEKKARKEEQMKRLTVAYENRDLPTLLELEQEWIDSSERYSSIESLDQLKIYNTILREQIEIIKDRMAMQLLHPKYFPIQRFYGDRFTGIAPLWEVYQEMKIDLENIESFIEQLKSPQAEEILRRTLQQEWALQEMENNLLSECLRFMPK